MGLNFFKNFYGMEVEIYQYFISMGVKIFYIFIHGASLFSVTGVEGSFLKTEGGYDWAEYAIIKINILFNFFFWICPRTRRSMLIFSFVIKIFKPIVI